MYSVSASLPAASETTPMPNGSVRRNAVGRHLASRIDAVNTSPEPYSTHALPCRSTAIENGRPKSVHSSRPTSLNGSSGSLRGSNDISSFASSTT